MGASKRRRSDRAGRGPIRSPGRPTAGRREHRQRFWKAIARFIELGCRTGSRRIATGWDEVVPREWRHATDHPDAACGALLVLC